jgi:acyl carrier protein
VDEQRIAASIRSYIVNEFLLGSGASFGNDTSLVEGGVVDSMGIMEVVDFIEDEFGITIAESELLTENFGSVTQMATFVAGKLPAGRVLSDEAAC